MKKLFALVSSVAFSLLAKAQEGGDAIIDTADVSEIFTGAQSSMKSLIDAALPVVIAFVGGGLIIWGVIALIPVIKKGFGAGKGR